MVGSVNRSVSNYPLLVIFFLTGLTGLAYELVWIRLLILAFGSTQFAVTTVLVTFMAGLAAGSVIFGRVIDRHGAPLKVYAAIEVVLGVYCLFSPAIFDLIRDVYLGSAALRSVAHNAAFEPVQFALAFAALIVPTTLMGGTLPILVKYIASREGSVGYSTAVPYAVNTFGAVTGCLATGLFALYVLGVKTTVYAAGGLDILAGVLVFIIYGRAAATGAISSPGAEDAGGTSEAASPYGRLIVAAFAVSGFCSLAYETLWTRVFSLVLGSSVYAFTVMLATFLTGIAAGSAVFARYVDRIKSPVAWFALFEAVIGLSAVLSIFLYRELPFVFHSLMEPFAGRFYLFLVVQFLLCSAVMIVPTLAMGAVFPLVGRLHSSGKARVGKAIGDIYSLNTAGSIAGAFAGGFILIPVLGVQNGVVLMAAVNVAIAAALFAVSGARTTLKAAGVAATVVVFVIASLGMPPWEKMLMTMGLYANPVKSDELQAVKTAGAPVGERLLYYREGLNAIVTVKKNDLTGKLAYQANGKQEAAVTGSRPSEPWALLGHIPLLLHPSDAKDALLVGLGSGITLGAMERYPLKSIDVVEIEPAVVEAAGFFRETNDDALADPRVRLHLTDGRGFVFAQRKKYDVVVSAVSDPWISGVANLFTREYFRELSERLNDDGVVALWFQNYRITRNEFRIGVNTFASVFPEVSVWFHYTDSLDLVIIGSKRPLSINIDKIRARMSAPEAARALARIDVRGPFDLFDSYITGGEDLKRYAGVSAINTDERLIYEFLLPKLMYLPPEGAVKNVADLFAATSGDFAPPVALAPGERESFYLNLARSYNKFSFRLPQALMAYEKALEANPGSREARAGVAALKKELGTR